MKVSSPRQALEVYQAEFDAMWAFGGLWVTAWHLAVSGRPAPALAIRFTVRERQGHVVPRMKMNAVAERRRGEHIALLELVRVASRVT